jgi:hypothetical protein
MPLACAWTVGRILSILGTEESIYYRLLADQYDYSSLRIVGFQIAPKMQSKHFLENGSNDFD